MLEKGGPESNRTGVLVRRERGRERADERKRRMRRRLEGRAHEPRGAKAASQTPAGRHGGTACPRASGRSAALLAPGLFMLSNCVAGEDS